jgi:hypothetical protein
MDTRQFCLDNAIPCQSVSLIWDDAKKKKTSIPKKDWNTKITGENVRQFVDETQNGFAILTGRRIGSSSRFVVVDTDDKKAEAKRKPIPADFRSLLEQNCLAIEKTPNGTHYWFKLTAEQDDFNQMQNVVVNNKKMECVDLLANNGMCFAHPSKYKTADGVVEYKWIKGNISEVGDMPTLLYNMLKGAPVVDENPSDVDNGERILAFLRECIDMMNESFATDFDTWKRMGLALKSYLNNDAGFELWDYFSRKSSSYDSRGVNTFWLNAKPNGSVGIGTILYYVKQSVDEAVYKTFKDKFCNVFVVDDYKINKALFEQSHFYCKATQDICRVFVNKKGIEELQHFATTNASYTFAEFNYLEKDDYKPFIPKWLNDNTKRTVERIVCNPKIDDVEENEYNLFTGFDGSRATGSNEVGLTRCIELASILGNYKEEYREYILNWFALLIQQPWNIPRVCCIFMGEEEGCGKDTLVDFIGEKLIGRKYFPNIKDANVGLYDSHSTALLGTFFQKLEEASATANKRNCDKLKAMITSRSAIINDKGVKQYTVDAYPHFCMTTNNTAPVKMSETSRRFAIFNVSTKWVGNVGFWNETYALLEDEGTVASFYNYLAQKDISMFNPTIIPQNDYVDTLKETSICSVKQFLKQWIPNEWTDSTAMHREYSSWCSEQLLNPMNVIGFGRKVALYKDNGLCIMKHIGGKKHFMRCGVSEVD